jgi:hypothetical protein
MGEKTRKYRMLAENLGETYHLQKLGINGRKIVKLIFK